MPLRMANFEADNLYDSQNSCMYYFNSFNCTEDAELNNTIDKISQKLIHHNRNESIHPSNYETEVV